MHKPMATFDRRSYYGQTTINKATTLAIRVLYTGAAIFALLTMMVQLPEG